MSTTLLAVVIALVLGHAVPALVASMRSFSWWRHWLQWLDVRFAEGSVWRSRQGIVLALAPPLLVVLLVQWALATPLLGIPSLLFAIALLVYAWGPRDLDVDVESVLDAPDAAARAEAINNLLPDTAITGGPQLVEGVFQSALRRWFGVLLWFLLLGPFGALLYRLVTLSAQGEFSRLLPEAALAGARTVHAVLEWPVAQLMTFSLALVGNFDAVFNAWRNAGGSALQLDIGFLGAAARASVVSELAEEAQDYAEDGMVQAMRELPELRDAMSLVWRILLLWLAVLALFVIAGWVS